MQVQVRYLNYLLIINLLFPLCVGVSPVQRCRFFIIIITIIMCVNYDHQIQLGITLLSGMTCRVSITSTSIFLPACSLVPSFLAMIILLNCLFFAGSRLCCYICLLLLFLNTFLSLSSFDTGSIMWNKFKKKKKKSNGQTIFNFTNTILTFTIQ